METNSLTQEQIDSREIEALTGMPGWRLVTEDFLRVIEHNEAFIHDINTPDIPTHSIKSIYAAQVNFMKDFIEKPASLLESLKSQK